MSVMSVSSRSGWNGPVTTRSMNRESLVVKRKSFGPDHTLFRNDLRLITDGSRLPGFGTQQLAVTIDAAPVAIDERHGVAADAAFRRRTLVDDRKRRELDVLFVAHD